MSQSIFIVLGFLIFVKLLFEKWNIWSYLSEVGSRSNRKWIYKLMNCDFCLMFWIGCLITIVYGLANGFFWGLLIVPGVVSGLIHLIYKK